MSDEAKHVVMGFDGFMKCEHCGAVATVPMPMSVTDLCNAMNVFILQHRECPPAYGKN